MTTTPQTGRLQRSMESERWGSLWVFVIAKIFAVGAAVPLAFAWRDGNPYRTKLILLGAALYLISFVIDWAVKYSEGRRKEGAESALLDERATATRNACHSISSIPGHTTHFVAQLRQPDGEARPHLDRYLREVLGDLSKAVDAREVRVCLYMLDAAEVPGSGDETESVSLLLCGDGVGRSDPPRPGFDSQNQAGRFIIQKMNDRKTVHVPNTDSPPAEIADNLDCTDKYYKSFLAVPVTYNDREYGMLMVDSPEKNGLTESHKRVRRALRACRLLVLALRQAAKEVYSRWLRFTTSRRIS